METREEIQAELIRLYQKMADYTRPECASVCRRPLSCCAPEYCEMATAQAKTWGIELQPAEPPHATLPYMGPTGCIVPPHLRPLCTLHTCEINGMGFKRIDPGFAWTNKYFELRDLIDQHEWKLMDLRN